MTKIFSEPISLDRVRTRSGMVAAGGIVLCLLGYLMNHEQFYRSYLLGFLLWIGFALGALAIMMIHHLTSGGWGHIVRPTLNSAARTMPLFVLLFIPIVLGMADVYIWANPQAVAMDSALQQKAGYLNTAFFLARSAFYFLIWIGFALTVARMKSPADASARERAWSRKVSAPGLALYGLTATFAAVDWVMSLEPQWYSTIYGMSFAVGQVLTGLAFAIVILVLIEGGTLSEKEIPKLHDLGNLLLAFVMLWAYLAFSQYLIIWSGDLPAEIEWYTSRGTGGWRLIAMALMAFHFAVPFLLLLSRQVKRNAAALAAVALGILVFRWVDLFWITAPAFHRKTFAIHWLDVIAPVTIGAVWLTAFAHNHPERASARAGGEERAT